MYQLARIREIASQLGEPEIRGASESELRAIECAVQFQLPEELKRWLECCNGVALREFNLLGWNPRRPVTHIESELISTWMPMNRIAIATDSCGNFFCLECEGHLHPVVFVEGTNVEACEYVAASSLSKFVDLVIASETSDDGQPFARCYFEDADPELCLLDRYKKPWQV